MTLAQSVAVVVIGAGQAGLSAGYHLKARGFGAPGHSDPDRAFVILDANEAPGGAWQHRWDGLSMRTVNGIYQLPRAALPSWNPDESSNVAVPRYFQSYEDEWELPIHRPVEVTAVSRVDDDPDGELVVTTPERTWRTRFVINATGTWTRPYWPFYPGRDEFKGTQIHTANYRGPERFAGQRVAVVGGGISAVQHLDDMSQVAQTWWFTRRPIQWEEGDFDEAARLATIESVDQRARAGYLPASIISATGLYRNAMVRAMEARGVLVRHPMFERLTATGVQNSDGTVIDLDAIVWATGFRPAIDHLSALRLRTEHGGIRVVESRAVDEPRLFLIGYGPSQSTVGANRAGRAAATKIVRSLAA